MKTTAGITRGTKLHRAGPSRGSSTCVACGADIEAALARLGSLRCHDCRDTTACVDPLQAHTWRRGRAFLAFRLGRADRVNH